MTAQALGLLNRKLTVLGSMLPGHSATDTSPYVPTAVSLSGSGIAFDSSENREQPYRVRLDFDRDELAQEQTIRYVAQRQAMPPPPGA